MKRIEVVDVGVELENAKARLAVEIAKELYAPMPDKPKVYRFGKQKRNQLKRERRRNRGKR